MDTTATTAFTCAPTLNALDQLSTYSPNIPYSLETFGKISPGERDVLFSMLSYWGIIQISGNCFSIPSESALLFIKSITQYMKYNLKVISSWDEVSAIPSSINSQNIFHANIFLYCFEQRRKELCSDIPFEPIKEESLVRVVLKRKIWWSDHVLMQYDPHVDAYQLIGGIAKSEDKENPKATLKRKLHEELPQVNLNEENCYFDEIYSSGTAPEEIFLSKKFKVYVRYKTRIYNIRPKALLDKSILRTIRENHNNRWISLIEIEKGVASDKKPIFPLQARALAEIKKEQNCAFKAGFSVIYFLEKPWMRVVLAVCTLLGVGIWGLLQGLWKFLGGP